MLLKNIYFLTGIACAIGMLASCDKQESEAKLNAEIALDYAKYLGGGVDTTQRNRFSGMAIDSRSQVPIRNTGRSIQNTDFDIVETNSQLRELYARTLSKKTSAKVYGADIEASLEHFSENTLTNEQNMMSLAIVSVFMRDEVVLNEGKFTSYAASLIDSGDKESFMRSYGNAFASRTHLGGYLLIQYNVVSNKTSEQDIKRLKWALGVKYAEIAGSQVSGEHKREATTILSETTRSGRVISTARGLSSNNLIDNAEMYKDAVKDFVRYYESANAEFHVMAVEYSPYWQLPGSGYYNADLFPEYIDSKPAEQPDHEAVNDKFEGDGLRGEYYNTIDMTGQYVERIDPRISFIWGKGSPMPGSIGKDYFAIRWTGKIKAPETGFYNFTLLSDDGVRLWIDGKTVVDKWEAMSSKENVGRVYLEAYKMYDIELHYFDRTADALVNLFWSTATRKKEIIPQMYLYSQ